LKLLQACDATNGNPLVRLSYRLTLCIHTLQANYATALSWFANHELCHTTLNELQANYATALSWFAKAAALNDPLGELQYGMMLHHGVTAAADPIKAGASFKAAATHGSIHALYAALPSLAAKPP
jgi:TPR repeat protein